MIKAVTNRNTAEMGLVKKIAQEPSETMRDCRRPSSAIGPKIRPITIGASGKLNLVKKYPMTPKISAVPTSKREEFPATPLLL